MGKMAELLLEILSEEIPAGLQSDGAESMRSLVCQKLQAAGLSFGSATAYVTPRRLVVVVTDLPAAQTDQIEERKGPRINAPARAIEGFLKSADCDSVDDQSIETRDIKGIKFYFVKRLVQGRPTKDLLSDLIPDSILELRWPKSMRWADGKLKWVRPIHSVLCVFDGSTVAGGLSVKLGGAETGSSSMRFQNTTQGHPVLAPKVFKVSSFKEYREKLFKSFVVLETEQRKKIISHKLNKLAEEYGLFTHDNERLLSENAGLVEWPVILSGTFDEEFLELPDEVLMTSMQNHQKYFPLYAKDGSLAPRFVLVSNLQTKDSGSAIIAGNERVLRARLFDAKFFWDSDLKISLSDYVKRLGAITFHAKLGSMAEKIRRLSVLASRLAEGIPGADRDLVQRAALLCKADLVTEMVGEFPELQGVMGRYYAVCQKEDEGVANAIAEHYRPIGPGDICPTLPNSIALALADKIDILVGMFGIGEKPTGSKDPFALRRAALGVIRLILENNIRIPLTDILSFAHQSYGAGILDEGSKQSENLIIFINDRLKVYLRDTGYDHDVISATFAAAAEDDLWRLVTRVEALKGFLLSPSAADLLNAYNRASNIVRIEERKDGVLYNSDVVEELLVEQAEKTLFERLVSFRREVDLALKEERYTSVMEEVADLREPVDRFFNEVTVNVEEGALRQNRLYLLGQIRDSLKTVADFSLIQG